MCITLENAEAGLNAVTDDTEGGTLIEGLQRHGISHEAAVALTSPVLAMIDPPVSMSERVMAAVTLGIISAIEAANDAYGDIPQATDMSAFEDLFMDAEEGGEQNGNRS